jgi:OOP family OmpA-OmpF porin
MKIILTFILMTAFAINLHSQNADHRWSLGLFGGKTEYSGDLGNGIFKWNPFYFHGAILLGRYLNPSLDLNIKLDHVAYGFCGDENSNFLSAKTDGVLLLRYKLNNGYLLGEYIRVAPYLATGVGFAAYTGDEARADTHGMDAIVPLGGGIRMNITKNVSLQYQVLYNFTSSDIHDLDASSAGNDHFISHGLGLVVTFGYPKDSDGDGVPDRYDNCPGTPTGIVVEIDGCPQDRDNDGIPDFADQCPDEAGLPAFSGCPDSDGDGIEDAMDACPDVRGLPALLGCPDRDGDGVKDSADRCPDVKGLPAYQGCPDSIGGRVITLVLPQGRNRSLSPFPAISSIF